MKVLTQERADAFTDEFHDLCDKYKVYVTGHVIHVGYGEDGLAAHCVSNAPNQGTSVAQCEEALSWYRDGKFRDVVKQ